MPNTPSIQKQTQPTSAPQPSSAPPDIQVPPQLTPKSKKPWPLISLVVLLLCAIGVLGYKYYEVKQQLDKQVKDEPMTQLTPPPQTSTSQKPYTEDTNIPNQKKYVNPELGISFLYLVIDAFDNTTKFTTKEMGNKIYVYPEEHSYETGQYVEVFPKNSELSLKNAIQNVFLKNYSPEKCFVVERNLSDNYPSTYTSATISFPRGDTSIPIQEMSAKARECPRIYTEFGGSAFFLMDQKHSDKFAFFSIGQYGIAANKDNVMWEDTIEFID